MKGQGFQSTRCFGLRLAPLGSPLEPRLDWSTGTLGTRLSRLLRQPSCPVQISEPLAAPPLSLCFVAGALADKANTGGPTSSCVVV